MTEPALSPIENVRLKLIEIFAYPRTHSMRRCSRETGVCAPTIARFIAGKPITTDNFDKLCTFVRMYDTQSSAPE